MDNEEIRKLLQELKESSDVSSSVRSKVVKIHFDTPAEAERREREKRKAEEREARKRQKEEEKARAEEEARRLEAEKAALEAVEEAKREAKAGFASDLEEDLIKSGTSFPEGEEAGESSDDLDLNWDYEKPELTSGFAREEDFEIGRSGNSEDADKGQEEDASSGEDGASSDEKKDADDTKDDFESDDDEFRSDSERENISGLPGLFGAISDKVLSFAGGIRKSVKEDLSKTKDQPEASKEDAAGEKEHEDQPESGDSFDGEGLTARSDDSKEMHELPSYWDDEPGTFSEPGDPGTHGEHVSGSETDRTGEGSFEDADLHSSGDSADGGAGEDETDAGVQARSVGDQDSKERADVREYGPDEEWKRRMEEPPRKKTFFEKLGFERREKSGSVKKEKKPRREKREKDRKKDRNKAADSAAPAQSSASVNDDLQGGDVLNGAVPEGTAAQGGVQTEAAAYREGLQGEDAAAYDAGLQGEDAAAYDAGLQGEDAAAYGEGLQEAMAAYDEDLPEAETYGEGLPEEAAYGNNPQPRAAYGSGLRGRTAYGSGQPQASPYGDSRQQDAVYDDQYGFDQPMQEDASASKSIEVINLNENRNNKAAETIPLVEDTGALPDSEAIRAGRFGLGLIGRKRSGTGKKESSDDSDPSVNEKKARKEKAKKERAKKEKKEKPRREKKKRDRAEKAMASEITDLLARGQSHQTEDPDWIAEDEAVVEDRRIPEETDANMTPDVSTQPEVPRSSVIGDFFKNHKKLCLFAGIGLAAVIVIIVIVLVMMNMPQPRRETIEADEGLTVQVLEQPESYTEQGDIKIRVKAPETIQSITVNGENVVVDQGRTVDFTYHATRGTLEVMAVSTDKVRSAKIILAYVDSAPPVITLKEEDGKIVINAEDQESGLKGVYVGTFDSMSEIPQYKQYSEPLDADPDKEIMYYAEDNAGNRSVPTRAALTPAKSIEFDQDRYTVFPGSMIPVNLVTTPEHAFVNNLVLEAENTKIVQIEGGTQIRGIAEGDTKITATADGIAGVQANVSVSNERTVTISAIGDCTLGTDTSFSQNNSFPAYESLYGYGYFFEKVKGILSSDDSTFANLEGTLTTSEARNERKIYAFKGDPSYTQILLDGSIDTVTLANNHIDDYGEEGIKDTQKALDDAGIEWCRDDTVAYRDLNGVLTAYIGIYALENGLDTLPQVKSTIAEAKKKGAELIIVEFHWGAELVAELDEFQIELAHAAVDAGANLVLGSHAHVLQAIEKYNGAYIVYGLSNFCFGGNTNPTSYDSIIWRQTFTFTADGLESEDDIQIIPCQISGDLTSNNYQPVPVSGDAATAIMDTIDSLSERFGQSYSQYMVDGTLWTEETGSSAG